MTTAAVIRERVRYSTPEDIDTRRGTSRRFLVDRYELHADHIEAIRCAFAESIGTMTRFIDAEPLTKSAAYWVSELWSLERACWALGIETDA